MTAQSVRCYQNNDSIFFPYDPPGTYRGLDRVCKTPPQSFKGKQQSNHVYPLMALNGCRSALSMRCC